MNNKTKNFIKKSIEIHGDKYLYNKSFIENNWNERVKIICPIHGEFEQIAVNHVQGCGCKKCISIERIKKMSNSFIKKSIEIHDDKYDYSLVEYIQNNKKIKIICPIHGEFLQLPQSHLKGSGCGICAGKNKMTTESFIEKAIKIHENRYDYSLVEYIQSKKKIKIICSLHGEFVQTPYHHLEGSGCGICKNSKGEKEIKKALNKKNIKCISQKTFPDCRSENNKPMFFDFYLPEKNMCIEYDGRQHFESVSIFGGNRGFELTRNRDILKNEYCNKMKIKLLRIKYDENIEGKIKEAINE